MIMMTEQDILNEVKAVIQKNPNMRWTEAIVAVEKAKKTYIPLKQCEYVRTSLQESVQANEKL